MSGEMPVTLTENIQVSPAVKVALDRLIVSEPSFAVMVPPPQVPDKLLGVATINPSGRASVKFTPVREADVFGLLIEKLRLVVLPVKMGFAVKDLAITGGATTDRLDCP